MLLRFLSGKRVRVFILNCIWLTLIFNISNANTESATFEFPLETDSEVTESLEYVQTSKVQEDPDTSTEVTHSIDVKKIENFTEILPPMEVEEIHNTETKPIVLETSTLESTKAINNVVTLEVLSENVLNTGESSIEPNQDIFANTETLIETELSENRKSTELSELNEISETTEIEEVTEIKVQNTETKPIVLETSTLEISKAINDVVTLETTMLREAASTSEASNEQNEPEDQSENTDIPVITELSENPIILETQKSTEISETTNIEEVTELILKVEASNESNQSITESSELSNEPNQNIDQSEYTDISEFDENVDITETHEANVTEIQNTEIILETSTLEITKAINYIEALNEPNQPIDEFEDTETSKHESPELADITETLKLNIIPENIETQNLETSTLEFLEKLNFTEIPEFIKSSEFSEINETLAPQLTNNYDDAKTTNEPYTPHNIQVLEAIPEITDVKMTETPTEMIVSEVKLMSIESKEDAKDISTVEPKLFSQPIENEDPLDPLKIFTHLTTETLTTATTQQSNKADSNSKPEMIKCEPTNFQNSNHENIIYSILSNTLNYLPSKIYELIINSYLTFLISLIVLLLIIFILLTTVIYLFCKRHSESTCLYARYVESHVVLNSTKCLGQSHNNTLITKMNKLENAEMQQPEFQLTECFVLTENETEKVDNTEKAKDTKKLFKELNYSFLKKNIFFSKLSRSKSPSHDNDPIVENTHL